MWKNENMKKILRVGAWGIVAGLSVISLVLFGWNYRNMEKATRHAEENAVAQANNLIHYIQEYRVVKTDLDKANQKILAVTRELEKVNADFAATRNDVISLQGLNDELKANIAVLEHYQDSYKVREKELEELIRSLKKKNADLDSELQGVRKELAEFQPDIADWKEGQKKLRRFRDQMRLVKKNMASWKKKVAQARVEAQKERDRLESAYGNAGFMVKDGQSKSVNNFREKAVNIDVKFLNR